MAKPSYSIDSSSLVHGFRRIYRPKNFGSVWKQMDGLIEEGRLRASIEVYNEIKRKDDELFEWCKERKEKLFDEIDDETQEVVTELMAKYPRLVDTTTGRSGGDPFVIARAAIGEPKLIVVTEEYTGKVRIPHVCDGEGIEWCRLADMIEKEGWDI